MTDIIIYIVLPLIGSVFIIYAFFYSMERIGTNVIISRWKKRLITWSCITVIIGVSLLGNGILNLILLLLIPVTGHFLYHNSRLYIAYYVGFVIGVYLTDCVVMLLIQLLYSSGSIYFINDKAYYVVMEITLRFLEFMVLKLFVGIIRRKHGERITRRQLISYFLLPAFSIVNLFSMMNFMQLYFSEENLLLLAINIALLIGLNIYFTGAFDILSRNNHLENELNLQKQQQSILADYYGNLEQKYDSTRKLVHDIRNHIQAMEQLYEEQKNSEGCQYAKDVHSMLNQLGQKYYTSCRMLNIILNDKVQNMRLLGITEDIMVHEADLGRIRDVDITTLFANILDNAIEAAAPSEEKLISLRVCAVHEMITITLKNSIVVAPVKKGELFQSAKADHDGLGLKNVKRVVEKYKGDIQFEWNNKTFITRIMLTG